MTFVHLEQIWETEPHDLGDISWRADNTEQEARFQAMMRGLGRFCTTLAVERVKHPEMGARDETTFAFPCQLLQLGEPVDLVGLGDGYTGTGQYADGFLPDLASAACRVVSETTNGKRRVTVTDLGGQKSQLLRMPTGRFIFHGLTPDAASEAEAASMFLADDRKI